MDVRPAPGTGGGAEVPTCFRHPERETYLSCVRCGRPACPECLRSAPVGQQCVECIKEGNRGVRRPAAIFGGRAVSGALVTYTLVGLNVLFYLVEWVYPRIVNYLDMVGAARDPALHGQVVGVAAGEEARPTSSSTCGPCCWWARGWNGCSGVSASWPFTCSARSAARCSSTSWFLRTSRRWALRVPCSACSAPGSWYHGGCRSTPGRSSF